MRRLGARAKQNAGEETRKVQRLLGLLEDGSAIACDAAGNHTVDSEGRTSRLPRRLIELCLSEGWLERQEQGLALSEAGRSWLRRSRMTGDVFRQQHQLRATSEREIDGARRPVLLNETESPLGWLKSRRDRNGKSLLTDDQYQAGERLRADYWFAQLSQRVTSNWSALAPSERRHRAAPSSAASLRDDVIAAKERVMRALDAVGPEVAGVLVDICCELKGLEDAERSNGWPQRAGKVVLQIALTRLARHYGLIADVTRKRGGGPLRHWGSEDYRPSIDALDEDKD